MFSKYETKYNKSDLVYAIKGLPLQILSARGKRYSFDMNRFMRSHWRLVNSMRNAYESMIASLLQPLKPSKEVLNYKVLLVYYQPDKRHRDLDNMCAVIAKFSLDQIVRKGLIPDDCTCHIKSIQYVYGGIDKGNHHVDLFIFNHKELICL